MLCMRVKPHRERACSCFGIDPDRHPHFMLLGLGVLGGKLLSIMHRGRIQARVPTSYPTKSTRNYQHYQPPNQPEWPYDRLPST